MESTHKLGAQCVLVSHQDVWVMITWAITFIYTRHTILYNRAMDM